MNGVLDGLTLMLHDLDDDDDTPLLIMVGLIWSECVWSGLSVFVWLVLSLFGLCQSTMLTFLVLTHWNTLYLVSLLFQINKSLQICSSKKILVFWWSSVAK